MKIRFLNLLLAGSIVISVMLSGCNPSTGEKGTFKDNRNGKIYKWVKIGEQVWMAENLNYTGSGTHITDKNEWYNNSNYDGWCYYENNENYSNTYGILYQWKVAKIACPAGWHLPTDQEWLQLVNYLIENGYSYDGVFGGKGIAKSLATDNGWWSISDKPGAVGNSDFTAFRNKTGFSALPSGYRGGGGDYSGFYNLGNVGVWWSATVYYNSSSAYTFNLYYSNAEVIRDNAINSNGFSVRCVRDDPSTGEKGTFKDNRDGKTYKWVKIGEQVWMADNLNYAGSGIQHITDASEWSNNSDYDGWCYYENSENYSNTYGVLYQWEAAKKACPAGWHLPTNDEWTQLENYLMENGFSYDGVVGEKGIAKSLATDNGWAICNKPGAVGNSDFSAFRNKTGFSALPGGGRDSGSNFGGLGNFSGWWSATEGINGHAYYRDLDYSYSEVFRYNFTESYGFSVRCVRD